MAQCDHDRVFTGPGSARASMSKEDIILGQERKDLNSLSPQWYMESSLMVVIAHHKSCTDDGRAIWNERSFTSSITLIFVVSLIMSPAHTKVLREDYICLLRVRLSCLIQKGTSTHMESVQAVHRETVNAKVPKEVQIDPPPHCTTSIQQRQRSNPLSISRCRLPEYQVSS